MHRERRPESSATIAADLERQRLQQRVTRMDAVIRELRLRARFHLAELAHDAPGARRSRTGRFDRTPAGRS